ncbi:hypothetical protein MANY_30960 [Mycolicibacterium anyangense]|uniref:DUF4189 domain-containing protein n=1 Tax=Mycolicibacterium anyangense TaxID=1431246 RepID=A0A6N4W9Q2_9MYCO|nr:hypothetical protein MANY_30960 [Mycolicibacterium anyangense]
MICRFAIITALVTVGFLVTPAAHATPVVAAPQCPPGSYVNPDDLSACLPNTPGNDYVALSASASAQELYWGRGSSPQEASRISIAQCIAATNSACETIAQTQNGCIALAYDDDPMTQAGIGPTPEAASADALSRLNHNGEGHIWAYYCSAP